ncbi:MAG: signal peptidase I [Lentisphaeria bacterium]|nr:DUF5684 domain-containing protein [Lentisphaeria bacterium]NQZ67154.1 signal peptidase I [Lentisphaeria bacterium]
MQTTTGSGAEAFVFVIIVIYIAIIAFAVLASIFMLIAWWKMFVKAGRPGWEAIVPYYNIYVLCCEIAKQPVWVFILCIVPCVNIAGMILLYIKVAERFGKGPGFAIGLIFLPFIFFPILGFGDAEYDFEVPPFL